MNLPIILLCQHFGTCITVLSTLLLSLYTTPRLWPYTGGLLPFEFSTPQFLECVCLFVWKVVRRAKQWCCQLRTQNGEYSNNDWSALEPKMLSTQSTQCMHVINVYTHTHTHTHTRVYVHAYTCMHVYAYICAHSIICRLSMFMHVHACVCKYRSVCMLSTQHTQYTLGRLCL